MDVDTFRPLLTAEIPLPVVEAGALDAVEGPLPRSLAQATAEERAKHGARRLAVLFALLVAAEFFLVLRYWKPGPLVVYQAGSRTVLVR